MAKTKTRQKPVRIGTEPKKKYAKILFENFSEESRAPTSEDDWDRGDTTTYWTIPSTFDVTEEMDWHSEPLGFEPIPGQMYYMVYAIWSTGDSFGHDERAHCESFGIYKTEKEAEARKAALEKPEKQSKKGHTKYLPWEGYFEHLDEMEIKAMTYVPAVSS